MASPSSPPPSSSESDSDGSPSALRHMDLTSSVLQSYTSLSGERDLSPDLAKIRSFLLSSRSGALSCLICLERIRPTDPTWSCSASCSAVFHLLCIQSWARAASSLSAERAASRGAQLSFWNCPKCRFEYSQTLIPKKYLCFCGKTEDPVPDPWVLPHSCGEVCNQPLRHNCGHVCLLLCHPGPCPSCPKLVKTWCFCGAREDVRRCGLKDFSCNGVCSKLLDCKSHSCPETCHEGECPPCRARAIYKCQCGNAEEERECSDRIFQCGVPCEKQLPCGKHFCNKGCHAGDCGECPFQGKRSCPCGKRVHEGMACDVGVPLCGATCEKVLNCGYHRCPERCHRGPCVETCRNVVRKSCRCGSLKKEVPCHQDLACERKCQRVRDCERHACKRRCCDGNCPPCSEICGRRLRCKNHKCPSPCHRGACAPCPVMVTISCACGETCFDVPCGTEKGQKPPKCRKLCPISPLCRHGSISKPHRCHYGACPPCKLVCDEQFSCGHNCKLRCHGPKPPPNPEFTLKPKKKKPNHQIKCTPGSQCPPCPEIVWRPCLGEHIGAERMMVCSNNAKFSCNNLCGNLLACGNHYCTKTCHALKDRNELGESCEDCDLLCQKDREPKCPHSCPRPCHPGECPDCKVLIKRSCHCGSMVHVFECLYYNSMSDKEQIAVRSCSGPCHRKLPYCSHLCPEICHPGQCPAPEKCSKKVTVRCGCQTLKKEWVCQDVQAAYWGAGTDPKVVPKTQYGLGLLSCDSNCKGKVKVADAELHQRKPTVVQNKEPEAENHFPKRRKRRVRGNEPKPISRLQKIMGIMRTVLLCIAIVLAVSLATYYGYKGLLRLSDWMNKVDVQKQRRRLRRI